MTAPRPESGFLRRSVTTSAGTHQYSVYVPPGFDRSRQWPVILSLHGSGERGSDGEKPTMIGIGEAIRATPELIPAIVVFPQAPKGGRWLGEAAELAMMALDRSMTEFNGDGERVYLTGLSMGGYGVWHLTLANPNQFAALVVVCGGILPHGSTTVVERSPLTSKGADPYRFVARALRTIPAWIFHGENDPVIPVSEGRRMAEALSEAGGDVRYTEYAGVGHPSWEPAYREPDLWSWLFAQRRSSIPDE